MTLALEGFRQALRTALERHVFQAEVTLIERRGIVLEARAKLDAETFIAVYYNALTGKASYALICQGQRVAGNDNYRFWHFHPPGKEKRHVPCPELTPEQAITELAKVNKAYDRS